MAGSEFSTEYTGLFIGIVSQAEPAGDEGGQGQLGLDGSFLLCMKQTSIHVYEGVRYYIYL